MAELDKYIIRYGQDADNLDREVVIADAQVEARMTYKVSGLDAGIWYFTILVQDNKGLLSAPSAVVDKEIKS
ncbi:MAG: fibronectin type III domain-containing protein [Marinobacter sp.]|uniref:fibronectin type III domain-containing protein n=1 Tax=Marinobacter sp. TaxID=50741 RepID=UPI001B6D4BAD|nr:fibronectin type III domain-containing protein [Marinobacter sp.]MBQ0747148.1 fibronectin type III domain-containing protein [Marinobacter sp.]MBQ0814040.1 fibronectin type III domain-containing protein [Marinobacter sp.]